MINRKSPPRDQRYPFHNQGPAASTTTTTVIYESYPEQGHKQKARMATPSSLCVAEQVWNDIHRCLVEGSSAATTATTMKSLSDHLQSGWTSDQALIMREKSSSFPSLDVGGSASSAAASVSGVSGADGTFNVLKPPIDCPGWLCILLPCINHLPSMKAFKSVNPDDAEVCRGGQWTRYDAASLVVGDVIRLEEGDLVPADCIVITVDDDDDILVDLNAVTGLDRPKSISNDIDGHNMMTRGQRQLYMGGTVVQGRATAIVTSIGPYTLLGTLIRQNNFPPKNVVLTDSRFEDLPASSSIQMASMA